MNDPSVKPICTGSEIDISTHFHSDRELESIDALLPVGLQKAMSYIEQSQVAIAASNIGPADMGTLAAADAPAFANREVTSTQP